MEFEYLMEMEKEIDYGSKKPFPKVKKISSNDKDARVSFDANSFRHRPETEDYDLRRTKSYDHSVIHSPSLKDIGFVDLPDSPVTTLFMKRIPARQLSLRHLASSPSFDKFIEHISDLGTSELDDVIPIPEKEVPLQISLSQKVGYHCDLSSKHLHHPQNLDLHSTNNNTTTNHHRHHHHHHHFYAKKLSVQIAGVNSLRKRLENGIVLLDIDCSNTKSILDKILSHCVNQNFLEQSQVCEARDSVLEHEEIFPHALGYAFNIMVGAVPGLDHSIVAFCRLKESVNMGAPDGIPTRFVFLILSGDQNYQIQENLFISQAIQLVMSEEGCHCDLWIARNLKLVLKAIDSFVDRIETNHLYESVYYLQNDEQKIRKFHLETAKIPLDLKYSGHFGRGLLRDISTRRKWYKQDWIDGISVKSISSICFLFFANITTSITFGGVMEDMTDGNIGIIEMILATFLCGILFACFSGQPLVLLGGTGAVVIFTNILYNYSVSLDIEFLPLYAWIGLWTALINILFAFFEVSRLIRYITRFTDEIFAALVSTVFIWQAFISIINNFDDPSVSKASALLGLVLAFGCLYLSSYILSIRNSRYLSSKLREFIGDFSGVIAILIMCILSIVFRAWGVESQYLYIPSDLTTTSGRPWLVNLGNVPVWVPFVSVAPALLLSVLVFLANNITKRLVNAPENKLTRGAGYHLDSLVTGVLLGICSLFGLPWLVAATVRSLSHVLSLATVEQYGDPDNHQHIHIVSVRENRVTGLVIGLLCGVSVFILPHLRDYLPLPVLYGSFMFMGLGSFTSNGIFERFQLLFVKKKLFPPSHYCRVIPRNTMLIYTGTQLALITLLWAINVTPVAIFFPLFIIFASFVRYGLEKFPILFRMSSIERSKFAKSLAILDRDETPEEIEAPFK